jgi:GT2 family glycosyltransferase
MTLLQTPGNSTFRVGAVRPQVRGKFVFLGEEKLYVRGVSYGTFRPDAEGREFADPNLVERDFALMSANGINTVRTYTVPPIWLLDAAHRHGMHVVAGLPWEQHIAFLDEGRENHVMSCVRAGVRACAHHPAILCYAIGNEIPAPIVRWHGHRRIERLLRRLYNAVKAEDPDGIVTYVNYPTTEYLDVNFVDLLCFNVYLEARGPLEAYLARLQNIAGDRPLIISELGLDSRRHGEEEQARALDRQIRTVFAAGCAGAIVFSWTDEWYRGGWDVLDWDFGLTDRARQPKRALAVVGRTFAEVPFPPHAPWPRISVIVCSCNGEWIIRDCLDALLTLEYPDVEVIVVDDGSTDGTAALANAYGFRVIRTENRGLSSARNTGMQAATGEIIAYIDDDAYPDPSWLTYLAATFMRGDYVGVGGPNIAPLLDGHIAECVANAPGGPVHVLLSDCEAEHIPGCNMSFRKAALDAADGFDPQFRTAGDDVDMCWRLQDRGWKLGFSPGAMVWHHRRNSVRTYWRQQFGYGRAEALLARKWPEKYNAAGHLSWSGRLYGRGLTQALKLWSDRIYHGGWGGALFQSVYRPAPGVLLSLPLMPEWYLVIATLAFLSALGVLWTPLLLTLPLLALAASAPFAQALLSAAHASFAGPPRSSLARPALRGLTAFLYLLQPAARLSGRVSLGLTPWRHRGRPGFSLPRPRTITVWSERWKPHVEWIQSVDRALRAAKAPVARGGEYDRWDLEVRGGILGTARVRFAVEEHGAGRQLARFRVWPRWSKGGTALIALFGGLAAGAAADVAWAACGVLGAVSVFLAVRMVQDTGAALSAALKALREAHEGTS